MSKDKPLFNLKPDHECPSGKISQKGFTRKDGTKVAPFCVKPKERQATLSGLIKELPATEMRKQLLAQADKIGCGEVLKKLDFLARISQDPEVKKNSKTQAEWLRGQPSCKIVRKEEVNLGEAKKEIEPKKEKKS